MDVGGKRMRLQLQKLDLEVISRGSIDKGGEVLTVNGSSTSREGELLNSGENQPVTVHNVGLHHVNPHLTGCMLPKSPVSGSNARPETTAVTAIVGPIVSLGGNGNDIFKQESNRPWLVDPELERESVYELAIPVKSDAYDEVKHNFYEVKPTTDQRKELGPGGPAQIDVKGRDSHTEETGVKLCADVGTAADTICQFSTYESKVHSKTVLVSTLVPRVIIRRLPLSQLRMLGGATEDKQSMHNHLASGKGKSLRSEMKRSLAKNNCPASSERTGRIRHRPDFWSSSSSLYECPGCERSCTNIMSLQRHISKCTKQGVFSRITSHKCSHCSLRFNTTRKVVEHLASYWESSSD